MDGLEIDFPQICKEMLCKNHHWDVLLRKALEPIKFSLSLCITAKIAKLHVSANTRQSCARHMSKMDMHLSHTATASINTWLSIGHKYKKCTTNPSLSLRPASQAENLERKLHQDFCNIAHQANSQHLTVLCWAHVQMDIHLSHTPSLQTQHGNTSSGHKYMECTSLHS
jgi:hypothetical protein